MARNGRLAEDGVRLVTVEDNDQLIATAAASFRNMKAAAAEDGVTLTIVEPAGAYRPAWVQNDMVDHPERYNLNPASVIGFGRSGQSHGWGDRIDVNSAAVPWMLKNAARFGWTREYGARDPNHFKHDGSGGGAGGDDDMELSDKIPTFDPAQYGKAVGDITLLDFYRDAAYQGKRAEFQLDGAIPSVLTTILAAVKAMATPDVQAQAKALAPLLLPQLVAGIGDGLATDEDLAAVQKALVAAVSSSEKTLLAVLDKVDEATLATFGLKRVTA